jgi:hypothetical protein
LASTVGPIGDRRHQAALVVDQHQLAFFGFEQHGCLRRFGLAARRVVTLEPYIIGRKQISSVVGPRSWRHRGAHAVV